MRKPTITSTIKLQVILEKRLNRKVTEQEIQEAYNTLMDFAFAIYDLTSERKTAPT